MPKRKQNEAVAARAGQILAEKAERQRQRAQQAAETRRGRRGAGEQAQTQAPEQPKPKRSRRAQPERKERKPRVHADLLTVAFRGPLAGKFREMAEQYQMSLTRLLQDALLAYESNVVAGYQPGTALTEWKAQQRGDAGSA